MRGLAPLVTTLLLAGCAAGIQRTTASMGSVVGDMQRDQVMQNIAVFLTNHSAVPSQFQIGQGTADIGGSADISTAVAFRSIAITGFEIGGGASIGQSYNITPVIGATNLRMLQILYQYAVRGVRTRPLNSVPADHDALVRALSRVANAPEGRDGNAENAFVKALTEGFGRLPPAPLVVLGDNCPAGSPAIESGRFCFQGKDGSTAAEIEATFVMWVLAIPQRVTPSGQAGAGTGAGRPGGRPTVGAAQPPPTVRILIEPGAEVQAAPPQFRGPPR